MIALDVDPFISVAMMETYNILSRVMGVPWPASMSVVKSVSRSLVDFGVLNDNLIKGLISCVKCISMFLMNVTNVFIDPPLEVQL
jgi:hypothetical protein